MSYLDIWEKHARLREGVKHTVYLDSLGKPTGGIGHLLTPRENAIYSVGDKITEQQVSEWFADDTAKAARAAKKQAAEIGVETDWFIAALISVNFQLGTRWTKRFKTTYPAIVAHDYDKAIKNLRRSLWYKQTPVRVEDFIAALERARNFKERPLGKTRTVRGASVAGASVVAAEVVSEAADHIEPVADYSETLQIIFVALALIGVGLTIYARMDDRKKGFR